jgi:hypothetical protein
MFIYRVVQNSLDTRENTLNIEYEVVFAPLSIVCLYILNSNISSLVLLEKNSHARW